MRNLTDAERDKFNEHLHKYAGSCPYCGASKVGTTDKTVTAPTFHRNEHREDPEDAIPMLMAVCQNCGFSFYFSADLVNGVDLTRNTSG